MFASDHEFPLVSVHEIPSSAPHAVFAMQFERHGRGNFAVKVITPLMVRTIFEDFPQDIQSDRESVSLVWLLVWKLYSVRSLAFAASTVFW